MCDTFSKISSFTVSYCKRIEITAIIVDGNISSFKFLSYLQYANAHCPQHTDGSRLERDKRPRDFSPPSSNAS